MIQLKTFFSHNRVFSAFCHLQVRNYKRPKMPQTPGELKFMREKRKEKRMKQSNMVCSSVYFRIVGNGAPGCPKSVLIDTDNQKYLFNCGEATQKIITEFSSTNSLSQMTNIFITNKTWPNIGGLLGKNIYCFRRLFID